jgi:hypothetical protein
MPRVSCEGAHTSVFLSSGLAILPCRRSAFLSIAGLLWSYPVGRHAPVSQVQCAMVFMRARCLAHVCLWSSLLLHQLCRRKFGSGTVYFGHSRWYLDML